MPARQAPRRRKEITGLPCEVNVDKAAWRKYTSRRLGGDTEKDISYMAIDGTYEVELTTTLGPQSITLTLETDGDSLSGIMDGHFGRQSFSGGTVSGEDVSWSVLLESPMGQMNLAVEAKVTGDQISGQVKLGAFQPSIFNGTRV